MRFFVAFVFCCLLFLPLADAFVYRHIGAPLITGAVPADKQGFGPLQLSFHPLARGTPPVMQVQSGTQLYGKLVLKKRNGDPISSNDQPLIYLLEVTQNRPRVAQATTRAPQAIVVNKFGNRFNGELVDGVIQSREILYDVKDEAWFFSTRASDPDSVQQFFLLVEFDGLTKSHGAAIYAT